MRTNFEDLRPEERRMILVASDEKYAELKNQTDWKKLLWVGLGPTGLLASQLVLQLGPLLGKSAAGSAYLATTWSSLAQRVREDHIFDILFAKGEIPIPHLSPREAAERFKFDLGHPEDGAGYLLNPCANDYYYLTALANERLAQEKLAVFMEIASALGAKRIELTSGEFSAKKGEGKIDSPLPKAAGQIGLNASFSKDGKVQRQVVMEYDQPKKSPEVPQKHAAWLAMDPTLRAMSVSRLDGQATRVTVHLGFGSTIDVGAEAAAKIADRGVNVGGKYRQVAEATWSFDVEFWPKR